MHKEGVPASVWNIFKHFKTNIVYSIEIDLWNVFLVKFENAYMSNGWQWSSCFFTSSFSLFSQIGVDRDDLSKTFIQLTLEFLSKQVIHLFSLIATCWMISKVGCKLVTYLVMNSCWNILLLCNCSLVFLLQVRTAIEKTRFENWKWKKMRHCGLKPNFFLFDRLWPTGPPRPNRTT